MIDGDTLWAVIDIGFGTQVREKLRLRGLDTPELGSPEGEKAKRFVIGLLPAGSKILLKTTRSDDKYGRYVADVYYTDKDGKEQYLNNLLLQEGLAVLVSS
ncbi:MAG: thermonuclease family protein [Candidatus Omnitrophota bacterium]